MTDDRNSRVHRDSNRNKLEITSQISTVATNVIKFFEKNYHGHLERRASVGLTSV